MHFARRDCAIALRFRRPIAAVAIKPADVLG
jgi:hypothetical protein